MAVSVSLERDFAQCIKRGTSPDLCLISAFDRLIADEQSAQYYYRDLIRILPETERPTKKENVAVIEGIMADESRHAVELENMKTQFEIQRTMWAMRPQR